MKKPKKITSLEELVELSLKTKKQLSIDCEGLILNEEGKEYRPYEVSICYRDLLFLCPDCTLNYDVNSYGDKHSLLLYSIEKD